MGLFIHGCGNFLQSPGPFPVNCDIFRKVIQSSQVIWLEAVYDKDEKLFHGKILFLSHLLQVFTT